MSNPSCDDTSASPTRKLSFWKRHSFHLSKKTDPEKFKNKFKDKKKRKRDAPQCENCDPKDAPEVGTKENHETTPPTLKNTDPKPPPFTVNASNPSQPSRISFSSDTCGVENPRLQGELAVGPGPSNDNAASPTSVRLSFPPPTNKSLFIKTVSDDGIVSSADGKAKGSPKKPGFMASFSLRFLSSSFGILSSSRSSSSFDNKPKGAFSSPRPKTAPQERTSRSQGDVGDRRQLSGDSFRVPRAFDSPPPPSATDRNLLSVASMPKFPTTKRNPRLTSNPSLHLSIPQLNRPSSGQLTGTPNGLTPSKTPTSIFIPPTPPPEVTETTQVVREMDPHTGNKMINQYMLLRELGRGCHGKVKLGVDIGTGEYWAIKIVDKSTRRRFGARANTPTNLDKVRREIAIMKKCVHPNVVRLKEVIDAPEARKIYLVLEYMDGGEILWKQPERDQPAISIDVARLVFRDVVLGLEYLHFQGIIHRDIKPANLLWTQDKVVKISDFGVSHFSKRIAYQSGSSAGLSGVGEGGLDRSESNGGIGWDETSRNGGGGGLEEDESANSGLTPVLGNSGRLNDRDGRDGDDEDALELAKTAGSPAFFAPELCSTADDVLEPTDPDQQRFPTTSQIPAPPPVTKAIDLWALGVTLYCFVYGRCPFMADSEFELFNLIPKVPVTFPADRYLDETAEKAAGTSDPNHEGEKELAYVIPGEKQGEEVGHGEEEVVLRNLASMEDRCNRGLGIVDDSLRDLISRLLEKDAFKRITLDEVKRHPWVTADLPNPAAWYSATDPCHYMALEVTDAEVKAAVTVMGRIRDQIRKLSISLTNLAKGGMRRRTKSMPSFVPGKDMIKNRKNVKTNTPQGSPVGDVTVEEETGAADSCEEVEEDDNTAAAVPFPRSEGSNRSISGRTSSRITMSSNLARSHRSNDSGVDGTLLVSTLEAEAKRFLLNRNAPGNDRSPLTSPNGKSSSTIGAPGNGGTSNPYFPSVAPPRQPPSRNRPASAFGAGSKTGLRGGDWGGVPML